MSLYRSAVSLLPLSARSAIKATIKAVLPAPSYNQQNAVIASRLVDIKRAKVLVVGANTGEDCKLLIKLGAKEVHGIDVIEEIGADFPHPRVTYHRQSIEGTDLPSHSFDLVYSVATMEHVHDITAGFAEMARLVKPGGVIYSVAAPLWFSPFGNHMACFANHPWVHVAFDRQQIAQYAKENAISGSHGDEFKTISEVIAYMMNPEFFNMRKAADYTDAIDALSGLDVEENRLLREDDALLDHPLGRRSLGLGFSPDELLPSVHRVIARAR